MSHEIIKCSCGRIIAQCRCVSKDKTVTIFEKGCKDCKNTPAKLVEGVLSKKHPTGDKSVRHEH